MSSIAHVQRRLDTALTTTLKKAVETVDHLERKDDLMKEIPDYRKARVERDALTLREYRRREDERHRAVTRRGAPPVEGDAPSPAPPTHSPNPNRTFGLLLLVFPLIALGFLALVNTEVEHRRDATTAPSDIRERIATRRWERTVERNNSRAVAQWEAAVENNESAARERASEASRARRAENARARAAWAVRTTTTTTPTYVAPRSSYAPGGYNQYGYPKNQRVSGYTRQDGTYVAPYWRNSPNDGLGDG